MKELQIRAGRIGLPYPGTTDPDALYWVCEDEIRQIQRLGQGCIVVLSSPVRSIETGDGTGVMHFYHQTIGATVDEVLSACEKVRTVSRIRITMTTEEYERQAGFGSRSPMSPVISRF